MGNQRRDEWPNLDDRSNTTNEPGTTGATGGDGDRSNLTGEMQELGQRLAATARALWQSEQRQELQQEVTDGLRLLRDQLTGAIDTVRSNPKVQTFTDQVGQKVESGRSSDTFEEIRTGLSGGLRTLNEQLQRFTERLERQDADSGTSSQTGTVPTGEVARSTGATMPEASGVVASDSAPPSDIVTGGPMAEATPSTPKPGLPTNPEGPASDPQR
jgi:hypothetical protein